MYGSKAGFRNRYPLRHLWAYRRRNLRFSFGVYCDGGSRHGRRYRGDRRAADRIARRIDDVNDPGFVTTGEDRESSNKNG